MLITIEHLIRSLQRGQPPFLIPHRGRLFHLQTGVTQHREKAGIRRKARVLLIKKEGIVFLFQLCRKMVQDRLLLILAGQQGIILEQAKLAQRLIVQLKDQRRLGRPGRLTGFLIQRDHVHAYLRPHQHPAVLSEKGHRLLALFHRYPFAFLIQADRLPKQGKPILDLLLRHDMHQPLRRKREKGIRPRGIPKAFDKSVQ